MVGEGSQFAFAVGSERETGLDIFFREVGKVCQNFFLTHSAGEVFQHIRHCHPRSANRGFTAAFSRLYGDDLAIIHGLNDNKTD